MQLMHPGTYLAMMMITDGYRFHSWVGLMMFSSVGDLTNNFTCDERDSTGDSSQVSSSSVPPSSVSEGCGVFNNSIFSSTLEGKQGSILAPVSVGSRQIDSVSAS